MSPCSYCGYEGHVRRFSSRKGGWSFSARLNGIDRVDNTLGYVDSNVVACCKACNMTKGIMDPIQWHDWLDRLVLYRSKQMTKKANISGADSCV
jgi:hypothetical protein